MIKVVHEPKSHPIPVQMRELENCAFCRKPTPYWYKEKDVAVCEECAKWANPEDVPSKLEWCRREHIAEKQNRF